MARHVPVAKVHALTSLYTCTFAPFDASKDNLTKWACRFHLPGNDDVNTGDRYG